MKLSNENTTKALIRHHSVFLLALLLCIFGCQTLTSTSSKIAGVVTGSKQDFDFSTGKIYVANGHNNTISMGNLDGSGGVNLGSIHTFMKSPLDIAIDSTKGKLYTSSAGRSYIFQSNLDGSGGITLGDMERLLVIVDKFALDPVKEKIYISTIKSKTINNSRYIRRDIDPSVIVRTNLDGSGATYIVQDMLEKINPGCMNIRLAAVNPEHGTMYMESPKDIIRTNLDGSEMLTIGRPWGFKNSPLAIAIDSANSRMYMIQVYKKNTDDVDEPRKYYILSANLDGKEMVNLGDLAGLMDRPHGIALDPVNKKMYISNWGNSTIIRANFDGTGPENLGNLNGTVDHPNGIAVLPPGAVKPNTSKK